MQNEVHLIIFNELSNKVLQKVNKLDAHLKQEWSFTALKNEMIKDSSRTLLIFVEEKIIGFALFSLDPFPDACSILKIVVKPKFRNLGIGKLTIDKIINHVRHLGYKRAILEVDTCNLMAIRLYKSSKFRVIRKINSFYSNGSDAFIMECFLLPSDNINT